MKKYIRSITTALICFAVILVVNFALPRMLPGDPVAYLTGADEEGLSQEQYQEYREKLHLDEPLIKQFGYYLGSILDGSLGYSYKLESKVSTVVFERLKTTMQISLPALILSCGLALFLGLKAGERKNRKIDEIFTGVNIFLNALPLFVTGLLFLVILAFKLQIFPYSGLNSSRVIPGTFAYFIDRIYHLILPVLVLVIAEFPPRFILVKNAARSLSESKYILFAKQRGLSQKDIRFKYILPGISGEFISMVGISMSACVGGSIVIENLFSIRGMGLLLTSAVHTLDYPLMQGVLFVTTAIMTLSVVLADILCIALNPELRLGKEASHE